ncbi:MAG: DUF4174 domain-containing protein [Myxococcota bacterium]
MNSTTNVLLVLLLATSLGFACKSDNAESNASSAQTQTRQNVEESEDNVTLPIEEKEPSEMVESVDVKEEHLWEDRAILLFAQNPDNPKYREMAAELAESREGVEDRDLVIYHLFWERPGLVGDKGVPVEVARKLQRRHAVLEDAFTFILIGKDGSQKMRGEEAVPLKMIFEEIDSMPMRKQEMKEGGDEQSEPEK